MTFVDPATGTPPPPKKKNKKKQTSVLDSYWNHCKTKLKRMKGCLLPSYLDEFMWRERNGRTKVLAYHNYT